MLLEDGTRLELAYPLHDVPKDSVVHGEAIASARVPSRPVDSQTADAEAVMSSSARTVPESGWGREFFERGWRGRPWVVLKRLEASGSDLDRIVDEARDRGGGWLFEYCTYHLLHAPLHHVWASKADCARIVRSIEGFPAQRVKEFESVERLSLLSQGVPPAILDQTAPRLDWRPTVSRFRFPVLVFGQDEKGGEFTFLPGFGSFDLVLFAWVRDGPELVSDPLALLVLLTCHGNPAKNDVGALFSNPLHPTRFRAVRMALRERTGADDSKTIADELQQVLLRQVPGVIASLRERPPKPGRMHSVARSRLAEAVCRELLPGRRQRPKQESCWEMAKNLEPPVGRAFRRSLTLAEASEVRARQTGKPTTRRPSTSRTLLARAKTKLTKVLQAKSRSSS